MRKEALLLAHCGICPNIVQIYGFHLPRDAAKSVPFLVLELIDMSLYDAIRKQCIPSPETRVKLLRDIAQALEFLRSQGLVHRDVKSKNILVSMQGPMVAKLSDLGEAKDKGLKTTFCIDSRANPNRPHTTRNVALPIPRNTQWLHPQSLTEGRNVCLWGRSVGVSHFEITSCGDARF